MKQMECLDCDEIFEAESPEEMMEAMLPHYIEKHPEMMEGQSEETKYRWMKRFRKNWDEAGEA